jgi:RimJ/RimL family protein N-acetyltransferase
VRLDIPSPPTEVRTEVSFERFWVRHTKPTFEARTYLLAIDADGTYAGLSALWRSTSDPRQLRTGMTAVRRAYRRRGIALALKVRVLERGRHLGYAEVSTENDSNNRGMLTINEQLGFVRRPAWVHYSRSFAA